ncbi:metal-binding protein ZinT [uncultured Cohaesibacter sp.]|uniref:ZinT family metal-binding protein n=1 Tax=uncultured Cohaesibacter sp. TaxID=1002546 RepID=UPI0029C8DE12|nr:metal-binding protein ZinT [uncultured Cohaesibacter sp.]
MKSGVTVSIGALLVGTLLLAPALATEHKHTDGETTHQHSQATSDSHSHGSDDIYKGYFEDSQIKDRQLSDWQGNWQSVYPYLQDGTLDVVMEHKAQHGTMSADEYRSYYDIGYKTDVDRIVIDGGSVTFNKGSQTLKASYKSDGYEILTYKKGNRGVRFIFEKVEGDSEAPRFIQFSDHRIAPADADHYHLYWGNNRAELLKEVTNWPTYYPASLTGDEIVKEMLAH